MSVDFELLKYLNALKRESLVETGKNAKLLAETERSAHYDLRSLNADRTLDIADAFSHDLRSDATDANCRFSHDVTKFQTSEILILLKFYFHAV